jgi:uncharacterized OB-fold protein
MAPQTAMPAGAPSPARAPTIAEVREAQKDGTLLGFQCAKCQRTQATPFVRCLQCGGEEVRGKELPLTGVVETFTIQRVAAEEFINDVPFAWAVIKLDDGTRVSGWIGYVAEPKDLPVGQRVKFVPGYRAGLQFEKA